MFLSCSGVLNIILNLFFVLVVGMDVAGVAIASVASQYVLSGMYRTGAGPDGCSACPAYTATENRPGKKQSCC